MLPDIDVNCQIQTVKYKMSYIVQYLFSCVANPRVRIQATEKQIRNINFILLCFPVILSLRATAPTT